MPDLPEPSFILIMQVHHLQAMLQLGMIPNPQTGQRLPVDLAAATHQLKLLEILREKTQGNLDDHEDEILTEIIRSISEAIEAGGHAG
ncbi:MAG: DUF1844 domain-containing protein [Candidatus Sumerlaeia bacterium]|nr:DUF1844 domain-containing protein [Candidatus Sumerlaeia bacterium]